VSSISTREVRDLQCRLRCGTAFGRVGEWRDVLRSKHIGQARLVLQHLMDLPIKILNQPIPKYIKKGDTRG
jgi:hypothetical protein